MYTVVSAPCSRSPCNWCVLFKMQQREEWRAYFIYLESTRTSLSFLTWQIRFYVGLVFFICCAHIYIYVYIYIYTDKFFFHTDTYIYMCINICNIDWFIESVYDRAEYRNMNSKTKWGKVGVRRRRKKY
jgi:hypothetical protein